MCPLTGTDQYQNSSPSARAATLPSSGDRRTNCENAGDRDYRATGDDRRHRLFDPVRKTEDVNHGTVEEQLEKVAGECRPKPTFTAASEHRNLQEPSGHENRNGQVKNQPGRRHGIGSFAQGDHVEVGFQQ